ncbi:hypothetical protein D9756_005123 [Leucocoprinus leucothites]|uniref:YTH domain-containing protein n=1 Tax=Leucocoprinus leucothites TaxID=201217 RepID=A0A8H5GA40_9AGAR|nr:hypothetical protein D9756_005123 [Leucoagaricus leucothites]
MADAQRDELILPSSPTDNTSTAETPHQAHPLPHSGGTTYSTYPATSPTALSSPGLPDNVHGAIHQHSAPHVYYGGGYSSPAYTMSTPPTSNLPHNPSFTGYTSFRDPRATDGGVTPQNPHVGFQPMLQPHVPVYYQPPHSAPIRGHLFPMPYPPTSPSHFSYPPRSFPGSPPIYQSYPSHHPYAPSEVDAQGVWYYLPHNTQSHADGVAGYQSHYSRYPPATPLDRENTASLPQDHNAIQPLDSPDPVQPHRPRSTLLPASSVTQSPLSATEQNDGNASAPVNNRRQERPLVRKSYHPNPPSHRSEWVMWVGNIPSDATHDELWKFFSQPLKSNSPPNSSASPRQSSSSTDQRRGSGVLSIFLISKSSCVFVNYETEEHLTNAIERFNGRPLRPFDPKCLRLVCRVRKRDDDLKAGVGGQRGQGLHAKWIKEQKLKEKKTQSDVSASLHSQATGSNSRDGVDQLTGLTSDITLSSDDEGKRDLRGGYRSSSGSFASTDSGLLSNFFPKRYFILKSLTQYDLDLSVQHGLWATQKHNEGILDQAYRTSKDVYLIFGVNKSGEFYGYARMASPVQHGAKSVLWASRAKDALTAGHHPTHDPASQSTPSFRGDVVTESPAPIAEPEVDGNTTDARTPGPRRDLNSAPSVLGKPHRQISMRESPTKSMTLPSQDATFKLDPHAPIRAIRPGAKHGETLTTDHSLLRVEEEPSQDDDTTGDAEPHPGIIDTWGDCFKVEWLCTERLPFYWSRNLRNPWNHDREVKISRDGTELEPGVGDMLLNAWEVMRAEGGEIPLASPASGSNGAAARKGGQVRRQQGGGKLPADYPSRPSGR